MRTRAYVFTINNYSEVDEKQVQSLDCQYVVYGREIGTEGTPHLQGYVYFKNQRSMKSISRQLPGAHIEARMGTHEQAAEYCKKDGDYVEIGTPPQQNGGDSIEERMKLNKRLRSESYHTLLDTGELSIYQVPNLKRARLILAQEGPCLETGSVRGIWIHGPPGTGKSHSARSLYGEYYNKAQNKWFDGYERQPTILLEDLDLTGACLGHHLKLWSDKWPVTGEVKGGHVNLVHTRFIITSNYLPEDLWPEDRTMCRAIRRRFEFIPMLIHYE